jgi:ABC-type branched-subunit amino acid transport system substrate-binding protein
VRRWWKVAAVGAAAVVAVVAATVVSASPASTATTATSPSKCSFQLKIGDVLPFTGDLAAYGPNLDRAVKLAVTLDNRALKAAGVTHASVKLVGSEDGQGSATAASEAATKLIKSNGANVIIGEMASGATIPMAQSVTIPDGVVLISPTSSDPAITSLKDNGLVFRTYPSDTLQGKVLGDAALDAFGKGSTINVGGRNDAFGTALLKLFVAKWTALGGKVGQQVQWNPDQANFDTEAGQLVSGSPAGWVIIDFPTTFEKFVPSLVRTGKWSASKTLMTEAMRNVDELNKVGDPANGLRGTAASAAGGPAGKAFAALWKATVKGAKSFTGFEGTSFDAANVAFLAAVKGCSAAPSKVKTNLRPVSGPPGTKVTYQSLTKAVKLLLAGKDVNYEGAFSPVDFDANGDIGSAVFEIWQYSNKQITTLKTITFKG